MKTDFRALCAELTEQLHQYAEVFPEHNMDALVKRARTALAEPKAEEPSKAELRQVFDDQSGFIDDNQVMWWGDFQSAARAVLERWGR